MYVGTVTPSLSITPSTTYGYVGNDGYWHGTLHISAYDSAYLDHVDVYVDYHLVKTYTAPLIHFGPWHSCSENYDLKLGVGYHTITVTAYGGGTSVTKSCDIHIVKPTPPEVSIDILSQVRVNQPDKTWKGSISVTAHDIYGLNWIKVYVDGKLIKTISCTDWWGNMLDTKTANIALTLEEGTHTISVTADGCAHVETTISHKVKVLEALPPTVTLSSVPSKVVLKNGESEYTLKVTAKASSTIGLDYLELIVNGEEVGKSTGNILNSHPHTLTVQKTLKLSPGNYTIEAIASNAGVTGSTTAHIAVVNAVAPTIYLSGDGVVTTITTPVHYEYAVTIDGHGLPFSYEIYVDGSKVSSGSATSLSKVMHCELNAGTHTIEVKAWNDYGYSSKKVMTVTIKVVNVDIEAPAVVKVPFLTHVAKVPITISCTAPLSLHVKCCGVSKTLSGSGTIYVHVPVNLPEKPGATTVKHVSVDVDTSVHSFHKELTLKIVRADAFKVGASVTFKVLINDGGKPLTNVYCIYLGNKYDAQSLQDAGNNETLATFTVPAKSTGVVTICASNPDGSDVKAFKLPVASGTIVPSQPNPGYITPPSNAGSTHKNNTGGISVKITNKDVISGMAFPVGYELPIDYSATASNGDYVHEIDIYVNNNHAATIAVPGYDKSYSGTYTLSLKNLPTFETTKVTVEAKSANGFSARDSVSFEVVPGKITVTITNYYLRKAEVNGNLVGWYVNLWYDIYATDTSLSSAQIWLNSNELLTSKPLSGTSVCTNTTVLVRASKVTNAKFTLSVIAHSEGGSTGSATIVITVSSPSPNVKQPAPLTVYYIPSHHDYDYYFVKAHGTYYLFAKCSVTTGTWKFQYPTPLRNVLPASLTPVFYGKLTSSGNLYDCRVLSANYVTSVPANIVKAIQNLNPEPYNT